MALTNAQVKEILSAAGTPTENVEGTVKKIIEGHLTSITALREERDSYKADAEKYNNVQKELDALKSKGLPDDWRKKYDDEHKAFETYRNEVKEKEIERQKIALYRDLLRSENVAERRIDSILRVTDFSQIAVKDGKLHDVEALRDNIKSEWSEFIMTTTTKNAMVDNPPTPSDPSTFESMSLAEKMAYANEHPTDVAVTNWLNS